MLRIVYANSDPTFVYAAKELKKYLDAVTDTLDYAEICPVDVLPTPIPTHTLALGLLSDFDLDQSEVEDPVFDDLEDACVKNGTGYFAGSNPRSVLFGIYDYFKAKGCYWMRPGAEGEHLEHFDPLSHTFVFRKAADTRFRGEMLEGAVKYEHVRATVEWAPKVHMNLFLIQGVVPYNFFCRWYSHDYNPYLASEDIGYDGTAVLTACLEQDIRRCGLQLHMVGHNYQLEPYRMHYLTSYSKYNITEEAKNAFALVKGKRGFRGSPSWSQLCMGQDKVLEEQVQWLADYVERKPHLTVLCVWMGDGVNNHCECPLCTPHHPSDLYVKMLNLLDAELTRRNLSTKISFDAYTDALWAPLKERFHHPDRFIFSTAICGRNYYLPYETEPYPAPLPKWERNRYNVPSDFKVYRAFFDEWRKVCPKEAIAGDYHFYRIHYSDFGTMRFTKVYYQDLHTLKEVGLGAGMINCQTQRIAFPTAFPILLNGEALFDLSRSYEDLEQAYFSAAYGEYAKEVIDYLNTVSALCHPDLIASTFDVSDMGKTDRSFFDNPTLASDLAKVPKVVDDFLEKLQNVSFGEVGRDRSLRLLRYHGEYVKQLCEVFSFAAKGERDQAKDALDRMIDRLLKIETEIEYEFDPLLFQYYFESLLKEG